MKKIDRLGWTVGFTVRAYGLDIGFRANDESVLERLVERLPHGWTPTERSTVDRLFSIAVGGLRSRGQRFRRPGAPRANNTLYSNAGQVVRTRDMEGLLERFESVARVYVAEHAKRRVFVHAGVVAVGGRAILVPGRSMSGKTTLTAELVRAGATYYSDEYAVIDARGRVHPFIKPLSMRENGSVRQVERPVEELGGRTGTRPIPVGAVVVTEFADRARWRPRVLTHGQAVLELLNHTVPARNDPPRILEALQHAAADATAIKTRRGEASDVVRAVLDLVG
jgi:hypothetical protein